MSAEKARGLSSRNLRRLATCTEEMNKEQIARLLRDSDDFILGSDGSKIASTKFQSFTIRSGTECFIFQLVAIPDEKSETVREAFHSYLSSFPEETQQHFASKVSFANETESKFLSVHGNSERFCSERT